MSENMEAAVPAAEAAPVAQPEPVAVEATQDANTGDDANPAEDHEGEGDPSKPKGGFQRRISELTYRVRDTERDRDHWRDLALQLQTSRQPQPQAYAQPEDDGTEFEPGQHVDPNAIISHVEARLEHRNRLESFEKRVAEAFPEGSEGVEALKRAPHVPKEVFDLVTDSDIAPKIAEYLGMNQTELNRLVALPAHRLGREFAALEARLAAQKPAVTKAPAPSPSVGLRAAPVEKDPDQMSTEEWLRWREAQLAKKS